MRTPQSENKMPNLKKIIVLLLLIVPIFSRGQSPYKFLLKGDKSPYDSGVVIHLSTYRIETKKLKAGDILVDSLLKENQSLSNEIVISSEVRTNDKFIIETQSQALTGKDSTIIKLSTNYNELHKVATAPTPFFQRPAVIWTTAGVMFLFFEILKGAFNGN